MRNRSEAPPEPAQWPPHHYESENLVIDAKVEERTQNNFKSLIRFGKVLEECQSQAALEDTGITELEVPSMERCTRKLIFVGIFKFLQHLLGFFSDTVLGWKSKL